MEKTTKRVKIVDENKRACKYRLFLFFGGGGGVGNRFSVSPKRVLALTVVSVAHIVSHCSATP